MRLLNTKAKDEQGAYAVLFAILVVFLIGMAALVVDLGNAIARKTDSQGQADYAALAAGSKLPSSPPGSGVLADLADADPDWMAVVDDARDFLNENTPQNVACSGTECVTSDDLLDHDPLNGEVLFAHEYAAMQGGGPDRCASTGLCVISPQDHVEYGLAKVIGFDDREVQADATVAVGSPLGAVPLYAVDGCDWGSQTLTDPAGGHAEPVPVPTLNHDTDDGGTDLESITPNSTSLNPSTQPTVTLVGKQFNKTTKIGFFRSDDLSDGAVVEVTSYTPNPVDGNATITFTVPASVTSYAHLWYVRAFNGPTASPTAKRNLWSAAEDALPFRVGDALLECDPGSSEGNFGTLDLPRSDVTSQDDQIAKNIATELDPPLTLAIHTGATDGECEEPTAGAVESPNDPGNPGTNCVATKTGLPANAATQGFVTGVDGVEGRLAKAPTTSGCDRLGGSAEREIDINPDGPYYINDDVLSCFLTDASTPLSDLAVSNFTGQSLLDPSIYDSPRLILVPVLMVEPDSGGCCTYSIIDFRPGFITGETATTGADPDNGVIQTAQDITQIKVFFFNIEALPPPPPGAKLSTYFGVGPKLVRLID